MSAAHIRRAARLRAVLRCSPRARRSAPARLPAQEQKSGRKKRSERQWAFSFPPRTVVCGKAEGTTRLPETIFLVGAAAVNLVVCYQDYGCAGSSRKMDSSVEQNKVASATEKISGGRSLMTL